jgi:hypothetical protein
MEDDKSIHPREDAGERGLGADQEATREPATVARAWQRVVVSRIASMRQA